MYVYMYMSIHFISDKRSIEVLLLSAQKRAGGAPPLVPVAQLAARVGRGHVMGDRGRAVALFVREAAFPAL